jgi:hypothetical protein
VQANARNDFALSPDTLAFGQVRRGSASTAAALVTFYGNPDARIVDARSESNYIRTQVQEVRRQDSEVTYQISTNLRPDAPVGKWYTDVWLRTNNPTMPQVRVPLTVEIESALSVTPEAVTLGQVHVNGASERRVIVRGNKPFKITRVQGTDEQVLVKDNTPEARAVHVLTVRLKAAKAGELNRVLRVQTDLAEDNLIDLHVSALVTP